jgi:monoamine oxidase
MVQKIYPQFELTQRERDTPWPKLYNQVADHFLGTLTPEIRKQFLMILPEYSPQYEAIMNISERQALAMFGLSTEAIHLVMSAMPITGALSDSSYETSLNEGYSMDFSNLYRIDGGMVNLPISFYRSLTSRYPKEYGDIPQGALGKVTWMGGSYVLGVHEANDNKGIVLAYRKGTVSEILYDSFDYAISAVPMSLLREAYIRPRFSGRKMEAISRIRYVDAQKTLLLCSERFWEKQGIKGGSSATDEIIQMIAYPSDHAFCNPDTTGCSPEDPGVLLASYNFLQDAIRLGNALPVIRFRLINRLVEEVHGLPEDYLRSRVLAAKTVDWNREMWAQGAFCYFLAGQKKDFLYVSTMPEYNNRVFFAGEHASTKNAWIQGALQSGMLAANNLAYHAVRQRR